MNVMESVSCPICATDGTEFLFERWGHRVVQCRRCDLAYVNPRTVRVESEEYFRGPYLSSIEQNGVLKENVKLLYQAAIDNLTAHLRPGRLLDVGCAMGHFMAFARGQ